jgi:hypothetical protein
MDGGRLHVANVVLAAGQDQLQGLEENEMNSQALFRLAGLIGLSALRSAGHQRRGSAAIDGRRSGSSCDQPKTDP